MDPQQAIFYVHRLLLRKVCLHIHLEATFPWHAENSMNVQTTMSDSLCFFRCETGPSGTIIKSSRKASCVGDLGLRATLVTKVEYTL